MKIKVMTFNILHGSDYPGDRTVKLQYVADTIRELDADIVVLNEVRNSGSDPEYSEQTRRIAQLLGWKYYHFARAITFPDGGDYGNAILSRLPMSDVETVPIPDPPVRDEDVYYETRCALRAHFDVGGGLTVIGAHFGLAKSEQRNAVATLTALADGVTDTPVIMGDFNLPPDSDILKPLTERFYDTSELAHNKLSWPVGVPERKIDYIFTGKGVKVTQAEIPHAGHSDHYPHYAVIEI